MIKYEVYKKERTEKEERRRKFLKKIKEIRASIDYHINEFEKERKNMKKRQREDMTEEEDIEERNQIITYRFECNDKNEKPDQPLNEYQAPMRISYPVNGYNPLFTS